jgi:hypothetical protein
VPSQVWININTIRHWILIRRGDSPDDPSLTNKMVAKLTAKDIAPLFVPMRFVGWRRHRNGTYIVSALAKDRTDLFVFEVDEPNAKQYWGLEELEALLGGKRS